MAFLALPAKRALMHIVLVVATDAAHRQHSLAGNGALVADIAVQPTVAAIEAKLIVAEMHKWIDELEVNGKPRSTFDSRQSVWLITA